MACQLGAKRPAGYCKLHKSTMSVKQIKNRHCLRKQCRHLRKIKTHSWWEQRELMSYKRHHKTK